MVRGRERPTVRGRERPTVKGRERPTVRGRERPTVRSRERPLESKLGKGHGLQGYKKPEVNGEKACEVGAGKFVV